MPLSPKEPPPAPLASLRCRCSCWAVVRRPKPCARPRNVPTRSVPVEALPPATPVPPWCGNAGESASSPVGDPCGGSSRDNTASVTSKAVALSSRSKPHRHRRGGTQKGSGGNQVTPASAAVSAAHQAAAATPAASPGVGARDAWAIWRASATACAGELRRWCRAAEGAHSAGRCSACGACNPMSSQCNTAPANGSAENKTPPTVAELRQLKTSPVWVGTDGSARSHRPTSWWSSHALAARRSSRAATGPRIVIRTV
eukprot:scaffold26569_cov107-Isochrysis_galbana.AAC.5